MNDQQSPTVGQPLPQAHGSVKCFRCDDGHTPLYCLNCARDMDEKALGEILDALESMARQHCYTGKVAHNHKGQVAGTNVTDSGCISACAEALEVLSKHGRFRIVAGQGRMIVGYWPENDPQKNSDHEHNP